MLYLENVSRQSLCSYLNLHMINIPTMTGLHLGIDTYIYTVTLVTGHGVTLASYPADDWMTLGEPGISCSSACSVQTNMLIIALCTEM